MDQIVCAPIVRCENISATSKELCARLRNRMPVVLDPETWPAWPGEEFAGLRRLKAMLAPYPPEKMTS